MVVIMRIHFMMGLFIMVLLISGCAGTNYQTHETDTVTKKEVKEGNTKAPLEVETGRFGKLMVRVVNRNDYIWHNVTVSVNEYYKYGQFDKLEPDETITIQGARLGSDFIMYNNRIETVKIETDEGSKTAYI